MDFQGFLRQVPSIERWPVLHLALRAGGTGEKELVAAKHMAGQAVLHQFHGWENHKGIEAGDGTPQPTR